MLGYDYENIYKKEKTMLWQMHYSKNMRTKDPYLPYFPHYKNG